MGRMGISCEYLADRLAAVDPGRSRGVLCHLGSGSSMTAIRDGRSVDTTMGFTPLEGLVMATRSGDLDPSIVLYLQETAGMAAAEVRQVLESESGLRGLSGTSGDFRAIEERVAARRPPGAARVRSLCLPNPEISGGVLGRDGRARRARVCRWSWRK